VKALYDESENKQESIAKLIDFPVQFSPPLSYSISRQRLINMIDKMSLPVADIIERDSLQQMNTEDDRISTQSAQIEQAMSNSPHNRSQQQVA
jgi:hypothetical protein